MKTIKLPYSPAITNERVMEILQREYPEKKVTKFLKQVRIKQNAFRVAQIVVIHIQKKNVTQITISATCPLWWGATIIIWPIFVGFGLYAVLGNWATEITENLNRQLQNDHQMDKPKVSVTPNIQNPSVQQAEVQKPVTNSSTKSEKVSFAKFANFNTNQ